MSSIGRKLVSSLGFVYKGSSSPSRYSLITHQTYSTHPASTSTNTATPTQIPSNNNNNPSQNTNNKPPQNAKMITGPLNEMLARNRYLPPLPHLHSTKYRVLTDPSFPPKSKFAQTYQAPPSLPQMVAGMRASGAGVVVSSCLLPSCIKFRILMSGLSKPCKNTTDREIFKIVSCSDPRLNPYQILGIDPTLSTSLSLRKMHPERAQANNSPPKTEATMVRNAGGRVMDAIRTLTALQTIGDPKTIVVMHHTGSFHFLPLLEDPGS